MFLPQPPLFSTTPSTTVKTPIFPVSNPCLVCWGSGMFNICMFMLKQLLSQGKPDHTPSFTSPWRWDRISFFLTEAQATRGSYQLSCEATWPHSTEQEHSRSSQHCLCCIGVVSAGGNMPLAPVASSARADWWALRQGCAGSSACRCGDAPAWSSTYQCGEWCVQGWQLSRCLQASARI